MNEIVSLKVFKCDLVKLKKAIKKFEESERRILFVKLRYWNVVKQAYIKD